MKNQLGEEIKLYFDDASLFYFKLSNYDKHLISNNKKILLWLRENLASGYVPSFDIKDMQQFINNISNYYISEAKRLNNLSMLSTNFGVYISELTEKDNVILNPTYVGYGNIYIPDKNNNTNEYIFLRLKNKNTKDIRILKINRNTGKALTNYDNYDLSFYGKSIDDILQILKYKELESLKYAKKELDIDYSEVRKCVSKHKLDLELRNLLLENAVIKIIYNNTTRPEENFEIADTFITNLNKTLNDCNLTYDELDKISSRNYQEHQDIEDNSIVDKIYTRYLNMKIKSIK